MSCFCCPLVNSAFINIFVQYLKLPIHICQASQFRVLSTQNKIGLLLFINNPVGFIADNKRFCSWSTPKKWTWLVFDSKIPQTQSLFVKSCNLFKTFDFRMPEYFAVIYSLFTFSEQLGCWALIVHTWSLQWLNLIYPPLLPSGFVQSGSISS